MACEMFQNLTFVMSILTTKVPENLLTNPVPTSRKAFFPEVLRLQN
jgi:hypothetical protein